MFSPAMMLKAAEHSTLTKKAKHSTLIKKASSHILEFDTDSTDKICRYLEQNRPGTSGTGTGIFRVKAGRGRGTSTRIFRVNWDGDLDWDQPIMHNFEHRYVDSIIAKHNRKRLAKKVLLKIY